MPLFRTLSIGFVLLAAGLVACSRQTVDLSGRACEAGSCVGSYTCDGTANVCVSTGDACNSAGRLIPCTYGATTCDGGCRECKDGLWTSCAPPTRDPECVAGTTFCSDASHLATCGSVGYIDSIAPCDYGCNADANPPRCNECWPGETQCRGVVFVDCAADGTITTQESCVGASTCSGAVACNPTTGCEQVGTAADYTPCDEGNGADGNWCNSACISGVCVAGTPASCDDGLGCTADSCSATLGCLHQAVASGTVCRTAAGDCDVEETCDGALSDCPADALVASGATCRDAAAECDVAEVCDGISADCPADALKPATALCRAAVDSCDYDDFCTGADVTCPETQGKADGTLCGTECIGTAYVEHQCAAHRCVAMTPLECNDGLACNGTGETCNPDPLVQCDPGIGATCTDTCACSVESCTDSPATCDHDFSGCSTFGFGLLAGTYPVETPATLTLTLDAGCNGQEGNIVCTTDAAARTCLYVQHFETSLGDFVITPTTAGNATDVSLAACGTTDSISLSSVSAANDCSGKVMRYASELDQNATLAPVIPISAAGLTNVVINVKVGYNSTTDGGEHVALGARCGPAGLFSDTSVALSNGTDTGGLDEWGDRPCPNGACSAAGYALPAAFDGCADIEAQLHYASWSNGAQNEAAQVDDFAISAVGARPLPVVPTGSGTYAVSVTPCGRAAASSITVTCTWNVPNAAPRVANATLSVVP